MSPPAGRGVGGGPKNFRSDIIIAWPLPIHCAYNFRSPAREDPVKREFVRYQQKEQQTEYPDMMEIPVRRIVTRKDTDEFCMAVEDEGSTDSMVMAIEDEEETVLAIKV